MNKFLFASLITLAAMDLHAIGAGAGVNVGGVNAGAGVGSSYNQSNPNGSYNTNAYNQQQGYNQTNSGSSNYYNHTPNSASGQSYYNAQNPSSSNTNPYNSTQGGYNPNSSGYNSNPSSTSGNSMYNSNSNGTANPYNRSSSNLNQPEAYNDSWGTRNYNNRAISQSNDATDTRNDTRNNNNTQIATDSKFPQDRAASDNDRQINDKIRDKITGWFTNHYKNIALITSNGIVTINGYVNNNDDLGTLVVDIKKVDGVKAVNNNVQVKQ